MSLEAKFSKDDPKKHKKSGTSSPLKSCLSDRVPKKHVKISPSGPTFYEDEAKKGLQIYSSLSRMVVANRLNKHCYLQETSINKHFKEEGAPSLLWYDYVTNLIQQRAQLNLLRRLFTQKYYTTQFLFKLQQFLSLQQEVFNDISFYQSHALDGETSKLPKLNILCKQIVSLLNDLDTCSAHNLLKSVDRSINLSGMLCRYQDIYQQITFDLIQCVKNTRLIILNEVKFCYLFANYRSRIYSTVEHVVKFNDIVYHPVLQGREDKLVILLEEVVDCNVQMASLYIARSYHHKILSAHLKSLPVLQETDKISDMTSSIQKCQVCIKLGHFLHKYCTNKCGAFLDAMSVMIQGAGENRVACRTDSCTSQHVETQLSRLLLRALYHQASSSVFYENRLASGDKSSVLVHEQFYDTTRKNRRKWDDNYTNVIYTCAQRGFPNSWTAVTDLQGLNCMITKLNTSYYSVITCNFAKELRLPQLEHLINQGIEVIFNLVQLDVLNPNTNDVLTKHFNKLSYLVLDDSNPDKETVMLLLKLVQHLNHVMRYLFSIHRRALGKLLASKDFSKLFDTMTKLHQLCLFFESLHKQLVIAENTSISKYLTRCYATNLSLAKTHIENLKDIADWTLQQLSTPIWDTIRQKLLEILPSVSYWKKDVYESLPSTYAKTLTELIKRISDCSLAVPEPSLTRVHHLLINNTAELLAKHLINNKKISFSGSGVIKLDSDITYVLNVVKTTPVTEECVLSTPIVLSLRNDLNALIMKKKKLSPKMGRACTCDNQNKSGNWKRLSAPQLCSNCSRNSLKPPILNHREIFSDSEVDSDNALSAMKIRQKKLVKERLEVTM